MARIYRFPYAQPALASYRRYVPCVDTASQGTSGLTGWGPGEPASISRPSKERQRCRRAGLPPQQPCRAHHGRMHLLGQHRASTAGRSRTHSVRPAVHRRAQYRACRHRGRQMSYAESGAITFSAAEAVLLHHAVRDFWVRHTLGNRPHLPAGFDAVLTQLASFVRETKTCASQPYSSPSAAEELIDTTEAAAILERSPQWVRRIRLELGGRDVGGRYVFPRQSVVQYAERKAEQHSEPNRLPAAGSRAVPPGIARRRLQRTRPAHASTGGQATGKRTSVVPEIATRRC